MLNPNGSARTLPEPPTTKAALLFESIIKPKMMLSLTNPAGLQSEGFHMQGRGVDVVATYMPSGIDKAELVKWSEQRRTHLLVARLRPGLAEDTVFELVYNQQGIITMIGDLALYTNGGTEWFLCPTRCDVLYFNVGEMGIEPQASRPWSTRQQRIAGFRNAAVLLAGAVGE